MELNVLKMNLFHIHDHKTGSALCAFSDILGIF